MLPDNLGFIFQDALRLHPSSEVLIQDDVRLTYSTLDQNCTRVAKGLRELGVGAGDRVALLFGNHYRFIETLLGCMRLKAIGVPLNARLSDEALLYIVSDSEAKVLIVSKTMLEAGLRLASKLADVRIVVDSPSGDGHLPYDEMIELAATREFDRTPTAFDDICMLPYTSGSTGKPKGVLLTHGGQIWNTDIERKALMLDDSERALVAVPLYHKNAMLGAVKPFLLAGGSMVVLHGFDPAEVLRAIHRFRATYITGVPAMYKMMLTQYELMPEVHVSSLRYAVCGSAEVPEELLEQFRRVFRSPIAESYGLTEGGPVPVINTRWGLKKRGSCGREFPGCDVKLVAEDGITEVGPDVAGELITRNPGLAKGYWKLPEVTAQRFRDGWLYTGDLLRKDKDGYFYFVGRRDDVIDVGGERVYPKEVEDILLRHANIRDVCVVPAPHPVKGKAPVAFVAERVPGETSEQELQSFFLSQGSAFAHPRRVIFLEKLPLNSTGKFDRNKMRDMASQITLEPGGSPSGGR
jgi:acyl-CoA synthetase (AMP-forming)/AMP-acid ligase II